VVGLWVAPAANALRRSKYWRARLAPYIAIHRQAEDLIYFRLQIEKTRPALSLV